MTAQSVARKIRKPVAWVCAELARLDPAGEYTDYWLATMALWWGLVAARERKAGKA